eukprot:GHVN01035617.1.p3 GENE.GHVN01035617.1~~GHVN01035617.1.p3  ORF type:complete len:306 (-),score=58.31 GHVN01035617.1:3002-3919(-)
MPLFFARPAVSLTPPALAVQHCAPINSLQPWKGLKLKLHSQNVETRKYVVLLLLMSYSPGDRNTSEEEDDEEDEENSELESEDEEKRVFVRQNRGSRYAKALEEEKTKQDKFWTHDTWDEEAEDDEWSTSDEEKYHDVSDSSMDTEEEDEDDNQPEDDDEKSKKRKKNVYVDPSFLKKHKKRHSTKNNKYVDPSLVPQKRRKPFEPRKATTQRITTTDSVGEEGADDDFPDRKRSSRTTTKQKTLQTEEVVDARTQRKEVGNTRIYSPRILIAESGATQRDARTKETTNLQATNPERIPRNRKTS